MHTEKSKIKYYIYKFLDRDDNIIYIGRTNNIYRRIINEHFTSLGHLPNECYQIVEKILYTEIEYESEEVAYEAILINRFRPKYNIQFKDEGNIDSIIPNFNWIEFNDWEYNDQFEYLKMLKNSTSNAYLYSLYDIHEKILHPKYPTGFIDIDQGLIIFDTSLILVSSTPGNGKTTYALNIACNMADSWEYTKVNKKILFINLKESSENLCYKLLTMLFQTNEVFCYDNHYEILVNKLNKESKLSFCNLRYDDKELSKIVDFIKQSFYDFVIIDDYDSIILKEYVPYNEKNNYIMRTLKQLTIDIRTPIMLLYQIPSNKPDLRTDHTPIMCDLPYSVQSYPDIIQFLYPDEHYNSESDKKGVLEVITAKNNTGKTFSVDVRWFKEMSKIANLKTLKKENS